jgi:hypothetical protein
MSPLSNGFPRRKKLSERNFPAKLYTLAYMTFEEGVRPFGAHALPVEV